MLSKILYYFHSNLDCLFMSLLFLLSFINLWFFPGIFIFLFLIFFPNCGYIIIFLFFLYLSPLMLKLFVVIAVFVFFYFKFLPLINFFLFINSFLCISNSRNINLLFFCVKHDGGSESDSKDEEDPYPIRSGEIVKYRRKGPVFNLIDSAYYVLVLKWMMYPDKGSKYCEWGCYIGGFSVQFEKDLRKRLNKDFKDFVLPYNGYNFFIAFSMLVLDYLWGCGYDDGYDLFFVYYDSIFKLLWEDCSQGSERFYNFVEVFNLSNIKIPEGFIPSVYKSLLVLFLLLWFIHYRTVFLKSENSNVMLNISKATRVFYNYKEVMPKKVQESRLSNNLNNLFKQGYFFNILKGLKLECLLKEELASTNFFNFFNDPVCCSTHYNFFVKVFLEEHNNFLWAYNHCEELVTCCEGLINRMNNSKKGRGVKNLPSDLTEGQPNFMSCGVLCSSNCFSSFKLVSIGLISSLIVVGINFDDLSPVYIQDVIMVFNGNYFVKENPELCKENFYYEVRLGKHVVNLIILHPRPFTGNERDIFRSKLKI